MDPVLQLKRKMAPALVNLLVRIAASASSSAPAESNKMAATARLLRELVVVGVAAPEDIGEVRGRRAGFECSGAHLFLI